MEVAGVVEVMRNMATMVEAMTTIANPDHQRIDWNGNGSRGGSVLELAIFQM